MTNDYEFTELVEIWKTDEFWEEIDRLEADGAGFDIASARTTAGEYVEPENRFRWAFDGDRFVAGTARDGFHHELIERRFRARRLGLL